MSRTKKITPLSEEDEFLFVALTAANAAHKMRESSVAKRAARRNYEFAEFILGKIEQAEEIEDLIRFEMLLQKNDILIAQTDSDRQSIKNAQKEYRQLIITIGQMREDPDGYFLANLSLKETDGDFRKLPKSRGPQQINANRARLQNRAMFSGDDQRAIWEARVAMAVRTVYLLLELHKKLVARRERDDERKIR